MEAPARITIVGEENWVAVAEQMGEFSIQTTFGGRKEASLKFGKWDDVRVNIYADGPTIDAATKACVLKARRVLEAMGSLLPGVR